MVKKQQFQGFLDFLKNNKLRQFNFFTAFFLFCLLPVQNRNTNFEILPKQPIARYLKFDLPELSQYPVNITGKTAPYLTSLSALAIDLPSKTIIYAKNPDYQLLPASTTKIMTALVSFNHYSLDKVIKIEKVNGIGQKMKLEKGEEITVENLLYGLLVQSGNDAAYVLAENYPGGVEKFVEAMNQKAEELNLKTTKFSNPSGIDAPNHFTTVHDLAILSAEAVKNPVFLKMVGTEEIKVGDINEKIVHDLTNVNQLLGKVSGLKGIKTGWTESAGECLVSYTEREGQKIITAVLASEDRFGETERLIEWVFANHQWEGTTLH